MIKKHTKHIIYIIVVAVVLVILYALKNTNYFVRISGFLLSVLLFYLVDFFFKLEFKPHHYLIFLLVATTGILFSPLYFISTSYDKILHFLSPLFISILVFFLVNKLKCKFSVKLLLTFTIIISILSLFEIGEYLLDQLVDWKLQGVYLRDITGLTKFNIIMDKNDDTMIDLIFGTFGTLFFVLTKMGIRYFKKFSKYR